VFLHTCTVGPASLHNHLIFSRNPSNWSTLLVTIASLSWGLQPPSQMATSMHGKTPSHASAAASSSKRSRDDTDLGCPGGSGSGHGSGRRRQGKDTSREQTADYERQALLVPRLRQGLRCTRATSPTRAHYAPSGALGRQALLLPRLRQGLRVVQRSHGAPSGALGREALLVRHMRQGLRVVQRSHYAPSGALGRQALLVRHMRKGLRVVQRSHYAPSGALGRQALLVRHMRQGLLKTRPPQKAPLHSFLRRIITHLGSNSKLSWDTATHSARFFLVHPVSRSTFPPVTDHAYRRDQKCQGTNRTTSNLAAPLFPFFQLVVIKRIFLSDAKCEVVSLAQNNDEM
jgi:hypothetical protein